MFAMKPKEGTAEGGPQPAAERPNAFVSSKDYVVNLALNLAQKNHELYSPPNGSKQGMEKNIGKYSITNDCGWYISSYLFGQFAQLQDLGYPAFKGFAPREDIDLAQGLDRIKGQIKKGDILWIKNFITSDVYPTTQDDRYQFKIPTHAGIYDGNGFVYDWPDCRKIPLNDFLKKANQMQIFELKQ